jgi:hypothetical protein
MQSFFKKDIEKKKILQSVNWNNCDKNENNNNKVFANLTVLLHCLVIFIIIFFEIYVIFVEFFFYDFEFHHNFIIIPTLLSVGLYL